MLEQAMTIKLRAERRCGELLKAMPDAKPGKKPTQLGSKKEPNSVPTLAEQGISKKESMTWQKLADLEEPQ